MLDKQLMQLTQGRVVIRGVPNSIPAQAAASSLHADNDKDDAGRHLHVNHLAAGAPLDILSSNPASIQRVPAVINLNLLPGMGRMTVRLPSGAGLGYSPVPIAEASGPK